MKTCSKCGMEKPLEQFGRNVLGKQGVRADCRECVRIYDARRYAASIDEKRRSARERRALDPARSRGYVRAYYARNAERIREENRNKYDSQAGSERARKYRQRFPEKHVAEVVARDAAKMKATPAWADKSKILSFYAEARRLTIETGIRHHVDHIIPLRCETACGLHCEFNLQVLPAAENQRKYNKLPMEAYQR